MKGSKVSLSVPHLNDPMYLFYCVLKDQYTNHNWLNYTLEIRIFREESTGRSCDFKSLF